MCSASMGAEGSVTLQLREAIQDPDTQLDTGGLTIGYPDSDLLADMLGSIQSVGKYTQVYCNIFVFIVVFCCSFLLLFLLGQYFFSSYYMYIVVYNERTGRNGAYLKKKYCFYTIDSDDIVRCFIIMCCLIKTGVNHIKNMCNGRQRFWRHVATSRISFCFIIYEWKKLLPLSKKFNKPQHPLLLNYML